MSASVEVGSKNARGRVIVGVFIVLAAVGLAFYNYRWIRSVIEGPVHVSLADLQQVQDPSDLSNSWIILAFTETSDTGLGIDRQSQIQSSKFILIRVGERWLIADVPRRFIGSKEVQGYLEAWWTPFQRDKIKEIEKRFPDRDIVPYQLDCTYAVKNQGLGMVAIIGLLVVFGIFVTEYGWSDLRKLKRKARDEASQLRRSSPLPHLPGTSIVCPRCGQSTDSLKIYDASALGPPRIVFTCPTCMRKNIVLRAFAWIPWSLALMPFFAWLLLNDWWECNRPGHTDEVAAEQFRVITNPGKLTGTAFTEIKIPFHSKEVRRFPLRELIALLVLLAVLGALWAIAATWGP
jgi:hypothetical protein